MIMIKKTLKENTVNSICTFLDITADMKLYHRSNIKKDQFLKSFQKHVYLCLQVLHGLLKCLWWSPLMVAQDGHSPVCPVVGQDFGWNVLIRYQEMKHIINDLSK